MAEESVKPNTSETAADAFLKKHVDLWKETHEKSPTRTGEEGKRTRRKLRIPGAIEWDHWQHIEKRMNAIAKKGFEGKQLRALVSIAYGAGLRVSELTNLKIENIVSLGKGNGVQLDFIGKGDKQAIIPLPEKQWQHVKTYLGTLHPTRGLGELGGKTLLFPTERAAKGGTLSNSTFNKRFKEAVRGIKDTHGVKLFPESYINKYISAHNIRHTFVTHLLFQWGFDPLDVQKWARHEDFKTTAAYAHLKQDKLTRLSAAMGNLGRKVAVEVGENTAQILDKGSPVYRTIQDFISDTGNVNRTTLEAALRDGGISAKYADDIISESTELRMNYHWGMDQKSIVGYKNRQAGAPAGTSLMTPPGQDLKSKQAVGALKGKAPRVGLNGIAMLLKIMQDTGKNIQEAYEQLGLSASTAKFELEHADSGIAKSTRTKALKRLTQEISDAFPDGLSYRGVFVTDVLSDKGKLLAKAGSIASLDEAEIIAQFMHKNGWLANADPDLEKAAEYYGDKSTGHHSTKEKNALRVAIKQGGSNPIVSVQFVTEGGNTRKIYHRDSMSSSKQPLFRLGGVSGYVQTSKFDELEKAQANKKITLPVWSMRKPNREYIAYFQHMDAEKKAAALAAAPKIHPNMQPGAVTTRTEQALIAAQARGILMERRPPVPKLSNVTAFDDMKKELLGGRTELVGNKQLTPTKVQPTVQPTVQPVSEKAQKTSKDVIADTLRGLGKPGKLLAYILGVGAGTTMLPGDTVANLIAVVSPIGLEPATTARDAFSEIEHDKMLAEAEREQLIPTDMEERGARQAAQRETSRRRREERQAPYSFLQQTEGEPLKYPAGRTTTEGRDVYVKGEDFDPRLVSELSRTFEQDGKWANVPSIHRGQEFKQEQLKGMLNRGEISPTSTHGSLEEAERAAKKRSDEMSFINQ